MPNRYRKVFVKADLWDVLYIVITLTLAIQKPKSVAMDERLHRLSYGKRSENLQRMPTEIPIRKMTAGFLR